MNLQEFEDGLNRVEGECGVAGCKRSATNGFPFCFECDVAAGKARLASHYRRKETAVFIAKLLGLPLVVLAVTYALVRGCIVVWGML